MHSARLARRFAFTTMFVAFATGDAQQATKLFGHWKIPAMPLPRAIGHEWVGSSILVYIYIYTHIFVCVTHIPEFRAPSSLIPSGRKDVILSFGRSWTKLSAPHSGQKQFPFNCTQPSKVRLSNTCVCMTQDSKFRVPSPEPGGNL